MDQPDDAQRYTGAELFDRFNELGGAIERNRLAIRDLQATLDSHTALFDNICEQLNKRLPK